jgi:hypothetical protein
MPESDRLASGRCGDVPPGARRTEPSSAERAQCESAVCTAAIVDARGNPLPAAVLDFIVASSDWRQDQHALEVRAATRDRNGRVAEDRFRDGTRLSLRPPLSMQPEGGAHG